MTATTIVWVYSLECYTHYNSRLPVNRLPVTFA